MMPCPCHCCETWRRREAAGRLNEHIDYCNCDSYPSAERCDCARCLVVDASSLPIAASVAELQRIWPGVWNVLVDGTRIGNVGGAEGLGGYDFQTRTGVHSVNPRRYPTAREAAQALNALVGAS